MTVRMWVLFSPTALMLLSGRWTFMLTVIDFKWIVFLKHFVAEKYVGTVVQTSEIREKTDQ